MSSHSSNNLRPVQRERLLWYDARHHDRHLVHTVIGIVAMAAALNVQLFRHIPASIAAAPKQTEPPFVLTQLLVLALFAWLGFAAFRRFRPQAVVTAEQASAPVAA